MSDMVERVARALCESHIRNVRRHDTDPKRLEAMIVRAIELNWKGHVEEAQAAIAAMQADAAPVATSDRQDAIDAAQDVLAGRGNGTYDEALDAIRWLLQSAGIYAAPVGDRVSTSSLVVAHETPETSGKLRDAVEVINYIAKASATFAHHAGVGGMETAGSIVSYLAANPQHITDFMAGGSIIDWPIGWHTAGCLSWHGKDGKIHHPCELEKPQ